MFAENLKYLRKKYDMEQIELANKLGRKSSSSISEWEKGKYTPKLKTLNEISKIFSVDIDDLMNVDLSLKTNTEESSTQNLTPIKENTTEIKTLPLYGNVAAGAIAEIEGVDVWNVETIDIPSVMLGRYANDDHLFSMYVNGDSMDKVIPSGSIIAVKTLEDNLYKDGDIVIFSHHGEYSLKRYRPSMIEGFVIFEPDSNNPDFKNIPINNSSLHEADEVNIYGKVIFYSTTL